MTVKCEHCGAEIEVSEGMICPVCNTMSVAAADALLQASKDKSFTSNQKKDIDSKIMTPVGMHKNAFNTPLEPKHKPWNDIWIMLVFLAAFLILMTAARFIVPKAENVPINKIAKANVQSSPVEVSFGEQAVTDQYFVVCDSVQRIQEYPKDAPDGYMYVAIHFLVTNRTDKKLDVAEEILVQTNGIQCEEHDLVEALKGFDNTVASAKATIEGTACFMIPERVDTFRIMYGSHVTIIADGLDIE